MLGSEISTVLVVAPPPPNPLSCTLWCDDGLSLCSDLANHPRFHSETRLRALAAKCSHGPAYICGDVRQEKSCRFVSSHFSPSGRKSQKYLFKETCFQCSLVHLLPFSLIICVKNSDLSFHLCVTDFQSAAALLNSKDNALRLSNATNEGQLNCSPTEPRRVTGWNTFFKKSQQGACHCTVITAGAEVTHF